MRRTSTSSSIGNEVDAICAENINFPSKPDFLFLLEAGNKGMLMMKPPLFCDIFGFTQFTIFLSAVCTPSLADPS